MNNPMTIVKTTYGFVRGLAMEGDDAGIAQFRSIPYAKPPLGCLRFAPPQPPECWQGIKDCTQWPDIPYQNDIPGPAAQELYFEPMGKQSEDCLYINIHTPAVSADEKLPVLLWYHDGGLTNGYAYDPRFQAKRISREKIVVVSVGHRIGVFGYMALPQLQEDDGCIGNYGFMDTLLALRWVHDNIQAFGGDPQNVTLSGESGGTVKCCALAACSAAHGLFRRVINQSGLQWKLKIDTKEQAFGRGQAYLKLLGLEQSISAEQLRELPAQRLQAMIDPHDLPSKMSEDGVYFKGSFEDALISQSEAVRFLNCICAGEGTPGYPPEYLNTYGHIDTVDHFYAFYQQLLGDLYEDKQFKQLVPVTQETVAKESFRIATLGLAPNVRSNVARSIMLARLFSETIAKKYPQNKSYTARFNQLWPKRLDYNPNNPEFEKTMAEHPLAPHGSDMWYSTQALEEIKTPYRCWREEDHRTSALFMRYLVNFIKYGTPNGRNEADRQISGIGMLPLFPEESGAWMDISAQPSEAHVLPAELDELIRTYVCREYQIEMGHEVP